MNPEFNLAKEKLVLPEAENPAFDYLPLTLHNGVAYLAGQLAKVHGVLPNPSASRRSGGRPTNGTLRAAVALLAEALTE